MYNRKDLVQ